MQQKLFLWQRIVSDTPAFFKKVQVVAVSLAGLGGTLAGIHGIPASLTTSKFLPVLLWRLLHSSP